MKEAAVKEAAAAEPDGQDLLRAPRRLQAQVLVHHQEHLQNLTPLEQDPKIAQCQNSQIIVFFNLLLPSMFASVAPKLKILISVWKHIYRNLAIFAELINIWPMF